MGSDTQVLSSLIKHIKNAEEDPFTPLLDDYLLIREKSPKRLQTFTIPVPDRGRPGGRLSPSSVCGCERKAAFVFLGVKGENKVSPEQQLLFDDGNWRHHKWGAIFLDMQEVLGEDVFRVREIEEPILIPSLRIAGHLDARIEIHGTPYIVDFKGINMWGFDRVFRTQEPLAPHVLQLLAYMRGKKVRNGIILYDDKNTSRTKVYTVRFTKRQWIEVSDWCEQVLARLEARSLPPKAPDCSAGNFLYERCPFSKHCWGNKEIEDVREEAFSKFVSVEHAWKKGLKVV